MSEKKPGFFRRMFSVLGGKKKEAAPPAPQAEKSPPPAEPAPEPVAEKPAPATEKKPPEKKKASAAKKTPAAKSAQKPAPPKKTPTPEPEKRAEKPPAPKAEETPAPAEPTQPEEPPQEEKRGWLSRLRQGLSKSSNSLTGGIAAIFTRRKLDAEALQELEDILIQADLGIDMAERITERLAGGRYEKGIDPQEVRRILAEEVAQVLKPVEKPFEIAPEHRPFVVLVVGVNGSGKTTTIGKLAAIARAEGHSVLLAAGDTFRAAAVEQLGVWAKRAGASFVSRDTGADAAALAYDAVQQAREENIDIVFIDTAGRLQNKTALMDELAKIVRVVKKLDENAPHAVLLVLDATTGQNAVRQTEVFTQVAGVTGLIMTKLDGTARGGILVAIAERFGLPVHAIGVGEGIDDLQPFDAAAFARAIAGLEEEREDAA
ncbi:MAG TPA: signal recognition particle-docking protein FtsY [Thermopetrobacter sp.]|nr:signal recognition particle-docking protein FtsY [Thermopetrobacter sp.]